MAVPADFLERLAQEPFRRTMKGAKMACSPIVELSAHHHSLLLRFNGETLFDLLLSSTENASASYAAAWNLHQLGLIAPTCDFPVVSRR